MSSIAYQLLSGHPATGPGWYVEVDDAATGDDAVAALEAAEINFKRVAVSPDKRFFVPSADVPHFAVRESIEAALGPCAYVEGRLNG